MTVELFYFTTVVSFFAATSSQHSYNRCNVAVVILTLLIWWMAKFILVLWWVFKSIFSALHKALRAAMIWSYKLGVGGDAG